MESLIKNYYKIPEIDKTIIKKALIRKRKSDIFSVIINSSIISFVLIFFIYFMINLNLNFMDVVLTIFFNLWSGFLLICEIFIWITTFILEHYITLSIISVLFFGLNIVRFEQEI